MAITQRNPAPGVAHHTDHGCQCTSLAFGRRLRETGLVASMGTIGDALDNAVAESLFATLECELLDRHDWPTRQALRTAVFDFIEVFYNRQRRPAHGRGQEHPRHPALLEAGRCPTALQAP